VSSPEQTPLITRDGARPKGRLSYLSALVITRLGAALPSGLRIRFTFVLNFIYNHVLASARMGSALAARALTQTLIFLVYFLVVGPLSLIARLMRHDYLGTAERPGSFYREREPADTTAERFERQY
jgi:hypothetical protein